MGRKTWNARQMNINETQNASDSVSLFNFEASAYQKKKKTCIKIRVNKIHLKEYNKWFSSFVFVVCYQSKTHQVSKPATSYPAKKQKIQCIKIKNKIKALLSAHRKFHTLAEPFTYKFHQNLTVLKNGRQGICNLHCRIKKFARFVEIRISKN